MKSFAEPIDSTSEPVIFSFMTNTANTAANTANTAAGIDRADVTRSVNLVKHELTQLFQDAKRQRPFFAASQKEAEAKLSAAVKVLTEFAGQLDAIKKR